MIFVDDWANLDKMMKSGKYRGCYGNRKVGFKVSLDKP